MDLSYQQFLTYEGKRKVIYTKLNKVLYGTLQAALLFWQDLSEFLVKEMGFEINPYDWCVANKTIDGKQCTIGWYVDDLKISHVSKQVTEDMLKALQDKYGKEAPLTVTRGKVHDYLGMKIDYTKKGKVVFSMDKYVDDLIKETPDELLKGVSLTSAGE